MSTAPPDIISRSEAVNTTHDEKGTSMISGLREDRAAVNLRAVAVFAISVCAGHFAFGGIEGRELVVSVQLPGEATTEQTLQAAEAQIVNAASSGADGVMVVVRDAGGAATALVRELPIRAAQHGLKLWIAVQLPNESAPDVAHALAALPVEGLALFFAPPQGKPADPGNLPALLAIKRQGGELGQSIRQIKRRLGAQQRLALCVALSETTPETTRSQYVPVGDLVRDGTVDLVALSEAERMNFHRLRLLRDAPLRAGSFLDARAIEENRRAGLLSRIGLDVVQNDTCELLWLGDFPVEMVGQVVPAAVAGLKQSQQRRAALEAALARGDLVLDQEVSDKGANDQASLHGVAQGFVPSRDGACPLVQVYAAVRGSHGPLPPPIHVEIRDDENGQPGSGVLAKTDIPAAEFGLEPVYRWGSAALDPPVPLKKGQTYWIYLTNRSHPDGNYVWRIVKDAAGPRGHAWSRQYDYTKHAWVFRVYLKKEPTQ